MTRSPCLRCGAPPGSISRVACPLGPGGLHRVYARHEPRLLSMDRRRRKGRWGLPGVHVVEIAEAGPLIGKRAGWLVARLGAGGPTWVTLHPFAPRLPWPRSTRPAVLEQHE